MPSACPAPGVTPRACVSRSIRLGTVTKPPCHAADSAQKRASCDSPAATRRRVLTDGTAAERVCGSAGVDQDAVDAGEEARPAVAHAFDGLPPHR
ncbi:hypothetical protein ABIE35_000808 [Paenarthrobacter sp. 4246]